MNIYFNDFLKMEKTYYIINLYKNLHKIIK